MPGEAPSDGQRGAVPLVVGERRRRGHSPAPDTSDRRAAARSCRASATCRSSTPDAPSRSAMVSATRRTRCRPRADRAPDRNLRSSNAAASAESVDRSSIPSTGSSALHRTPRLWATDRARRTRAATVGRRVPRRPAQEVLDVGTSERDGEVEAVEQGCGQSAQVPPAHHVAASTGAGKPSLATRTGVHRPDQQEAGREVDRTSSPSDPDDMLLERLAQCVEDRRRELAQLVQEEDAGVGQGDLARAQPGGPATHDGDLGGAVVWSAKRRP